MKEIKATRALKEEAYKHFLKGGTAATLSDHLKRLPIAVLQACQVRAFQTKLHRKCVEDIREGGPLSKSIAASYPSHD
jgi:hypothetical protein